MKNEAYRRLGQEEILTKDHYRWNHGKFVLLSSNNPYIGKKANDRLIFEKISLADFRILKDDEIITREHFYVEKSNYGYLVIFRCHLLDYGKKSIDVRKKCSHLTEFNLYAKKTQFNFETLNILKDIEL
jgi:hypothetical protein